MVSIPPIRVDSVTVDPALTVVPAWTRLRHPSLGGNLTDYSNGWSPTSYAPVCYRMNALGDTELDGVMVAPAAPAAASPAFFLPPGYRPRSKQIIRTHNQGQLMSIYIDPGTGEVAVVGAAGGSEIPLSGLRFQAVS